MIEALNGVKVRVAADTSKRVNRPIQNAATMGIPSLAQLWSDSPPLVFAYVIDMALFSETLLIKSPVILCTSDQVNKVIVNTC